MIIRPGDIIGRRYRVLKEIGQGGTGTVYLAYDGSLQKKIVIKRVARGTVADIRGEVDILKNLNHQGLPHVHDILSIDRYVYTFMDYIEGYDLEYYIKRRIRLPEPVLVEWMQKLTEILVYLHSRQIPILHSDIKPGNIMITAEGEPYLIDFNISLNGRSSKSVKGMSPYYAAPEQYMQTVNGGGGIPVDARMDLYSLGAVFYTLLSENRPQPTGSIPTPLTLMKLPYSMAFRNLIDKAMNRKPSKRFQSAAAMQKALSRIETMDPEYNRLTMMQIFLTVPLALFLVTGLLLFRRGDILVRTEKLNERWNDCIACERNSDDEAAVEQGLAILNEQDLSDLLDRDPERKARLLSLIAGSYYNMGYYSFAADYYQKALAEKETAEVWRDLAVALARNMDTAGAGTAMQNAERLGLDTASSQYIQAEIYAEEGLIREAEELLEGIVLKTSDPELLGRSWLLQGNLAEKAEDWTKAREAYGSLVSITSSRKGLRRLAEVNMIMAERGKNSSRASCLQEAEQCYASLCVMSNPSYEDQLNYALCLRAKEDYISSNKVLKNLLDQYPDDSRVLMWTCYNNLDLYQKFPGALTEGDVRIEYLEFLNSYHTGAGRDMEEDADTLIRLMSARGFEQ
jgi:serine/threonine protein kinase